MRRKLKTIRVPIFDIEIEKINEVYRDVRYDLKDEHITAAGY